MPHSAEPEHAIVQSPWQVISQDEFPLHEPVEVGPSTMLQSDELGHVALQLVLHCMLQLVPLAQLRLHPGVQVATQSDPPEQVQVVVLTSHEQLPVHVAVLVTSLSLLSREESPPEPSMVGGAS